MSPLNREETCTINCVAEQKFSYLITCDYIYALSVSIQSIYCFVTQFRGKVKKNCPASSCDWIYVRFLYLQLGEGGLFSAGSGVGVRDLKYFYV